MSRFAGLYTVLAACGGGGGFPDAAPSDDARPSGTFSVAWSVVDQDNQPISCERIAGQVMTVIGRNLAHASGQTHPFTCSTGMGTSQGLVPGDYEFDFELTGTFGLLATSARQAPVEDRAGANTELAPVTFQIEPVGNLALGVATGKAGGNCGAIDADGAGIEQVSI